MPNVVCNTFCYQLRFAYVILDAECRKYKENSGLEYEKRGITPPPQYWRTAAIAAVPTMIAIAAITAAIRIA